jgi:hypothetical protein
MLLPLECGSEMSGVALGPSGINSAPGANRGRGGLWGSAGAGGFVAPLCCKCDSPEKHDMVGLMDLPWCGEYSLRVMKRPVVVDPSCCPQDCSSGWTGRRVL